MSQLLHNLDAHKRNTSCIHNSQMLINLLFKSALTKQYKKEIVDYKIIKSCDNNKKKSSSTTLPHTLNVTCLKSLSCQCLSTTESRPSQTKAVGYLMM